MSHGPFGQRRIDGTFVQQSTRHPQGKEAITTGTRANDLIDEARSLAGRRVDEDERRSAPSQLLERRKHVEKRGRHVLAPQKNTATVEQVVEVMRIRDAQVGLLRRLARARADVALLDTRAAETLEKPVVDDLQRAQGPAGAVVQHGLRTGFFTDVRQPGGNEVERVVPGSFP